MAEAVAELREGAARSEAPVREFSDLHATSATAPVLVVDRPRWIEANLDTFKTMMDPVMAKLAAANKAPSGMTRVVGEKISGAELGALMSFMSSKVLGQFDPFWDGPNGEGGRLLLVAPNIVRAEQQLDVDPHDFRLWVCLHEETHRVQFTAVDWMRGHMRSLLDEFVEATDLDASALSSMVSDGTRRGHPHRSRRLRGVARRAVPERPAARDRRPADRHHVAPRGPCRRRDGRRRP